MNRRHDPLASDLTPLHHAYFAALGLPADVNGDMVGALLVTINPATPAKLRSQWSFSQPVLRLDLNESRLAA